MKTKSRTKRTPRYAQVIEGHRQVAEQLQRLMRITEEDYFSTVFQTGLYLLESYFGDSVNSRFVARLHDHLLKETGSGYWKWYQNNRNMEQVGFFDAVMPVFQADCEDFGREQAVINLREYWCDFNAQFAQSPDIHNRLRHFIIQNY